jgi:hypothetical protein
MASASRSSTARTATSMVRRRWPSRSACRSTPRADYDRFVQVLEMPADAAKTPAAHDGEDEAEDDQGEVSAPIWRHQQPDAGGHRTRRRQAGAGAWVVGDNPRLLFFPHIKPQTRYVVRVQPGLPAATAASSTQEARFSIGPQPLPRPSTSPAAAWSCRRAERWPAGDDGQRAGSGHPVPQGQARSTGEVSRKGRRPTRRPASRAPSEATPMRRRRGDDADGYHYRGSRLKGAVGSWELDQLHKLTSSVFVGRFLTEQKANRRSVTFIPVESIPALREPGVYVAVMSQPNRFRGDYQTTYFYVSDLGLHLRQYPSRGADAYVSSLTDGKARPASR